MPAWTIQCIACYLYLWPRYLPSVPRAHSARATADPEFAHPPGHLSSLDADPLLQDTTLIDSLINIDEKSGLELVQAAIQSSRMTTALALFQVGPLKTLQPVQLEVLRSLQEHAQNTNLIDLYFCHKLHKFCAHKEGLFAMCVAMQARPPLQRGRNFRAVATQALATAGKDGTVKVWYIKQQVAAMTLEGMCCLC